MLDGRVPQKLLEDDAWRMRNDLHGPQMFPDRFGGSCVLIGARSGLEAVIALRERPDATVFIVDPNTEQQKTIENIAQALDASGKLRWFTHASDLTANLGQDFIADFVRIDLANFDRVTVAEVLANWQVGYLCGQFESTVFDPLKLYRECRDHTKRFFLRYADSFRALAGTGDPSRVEVSVIVPAYNVEPWIDECLDSLTSQVMERIEIIVIDDGSMDGTDAKIDEWAQRFPNRVVAVHSKNQGGAAARMQVLPMARGEYIGLVDADDWVDHEMYEQLYRAAILDSAEVSQCGWRDVYERSGRIVEHLSRSGREANGLGVVDNVRTLLADQPTMWRRIYKRDFLFGNNVVFPTHLKRFDDAPFQFQALLYATRISNIPECYYSYRLERQGATVDINDRRLFVHFDIVDWMNEQVLNVTDRDVETYFAEFEINTHRWALSKLDRALKREYFVKAARQFVEEKQVLSKWDLFRLGARKGPGALGFVALCIFQAMLSPGRSSRETGMTARTAQSAGEVIGRP